jgi:hypothetical protein
LIKESSLKKGSLQKEKNITGIAGDIAGALYSDYVARLMVSVENQHVTAVNNFNSVAHLNG